MDNKFEFNLIEIHWINDLPDNDEDLCAHGKVFIKINDEIVSDGKESWTISATGLYLLRSLKNNYEPMMYRNFLVPCCAMDFWLENDGRVFFIGCPNGIDLTIRHLSNNYVEIISENGSKALIDEKEFRNIVYKFTSEIEMFYKNSPERKQLADKEVKIGFTAFWDEWYKLKNDRL